MPENGKGPLSILRPCRRMERGPFPRAAACGTQYNYILPLSAAKSKPFWADRARPACMCFYMIPACAGPALSKYGVCVLCLCRVPRFSIYPCILQVPNTTRILPARYAWAQNAAQHLGRREAGDIYRGRRNLHRSRAPFGQLQNFWQRQNSQQGCCTLRKPLAVFSKEPSAGIIIRVPFMILIASGPNFFRASLRPMTLRSKVS